ncbi:hypothetical protein AHF37_07269 [Paragonimus kellicotti]|nr:hypothetical protein AHF37_07269 [Paragonimus kellicotti]
MVYFILILQLRLGFTANYLTVSTPGVAYVKTVTFHHCC